MTAAAIRIVAAIAAIAAFVAGTQATPELRTALWDGTQPFSTTFGHETYFAAGLPRAPAGWIGDLVTARLFATLGEDGLGLLAGIGVALALAVLELRARERGGPGFGALALVVAFATMANAFHLGNRFASDAIFATLTLAALDRPGRERGLVVAVAFVWANVSPDAGIAVLFAFAAAAGRFADAAIRRAPLSLPLRALLVAVGTLAAVCATPAALGYLPATLSALGLDFQPSAYPIFPGEIAPFAYHVGFPALVFAALATGGGYGPVGDDPDGASAPADAGILVVALVLGFADGYLLPIAGIAAGPVLAGAAARRFGRVLDGPPFGGGPREIVRRAIPLALACAGVAFVSSEIVAERRAGPSRLDGTALLGAIVADPAAHALYCSQPLWCAGALGTHVRVGMYGRVGWPAAVVAAQSNVLSLTPTWYHTIERYHIDRVLAARSTGLAGLLRLRPEWHEIGDDDRIAAFARDAGAP